MSNGKAPVDASRIPNGYTHFACSPQLRIVIPAQGHTLSYPLWSSEFDGLHDEVIVIQSFPMYTLQKGRHGPAKYSMCSYKSPVKSFDTQQHVSLEA